MNDETSIIEVDRDSMISKLVLQGDVSGLRPREKVAYYVDFCRAVGLNPITRPFEYITMKGREVLYATKSATDQLRKRDRISIIDSAKEKIGDIYIVTVKASNADGRTDVSTGVLDLKGLSGEEFANALMKAETKAKRRVTLSICGLGMIDEIELDSVDVAPFVTDQELEDARNAIYQIFEDNPQLPIDFKESQIAEADEAVTNRDITSLELIFTETKQEISKDSKRESKAREPESIRAALDMKKASEIPTEPVDENIIKAETEELSKEAPGGELDIF